MDFIKKKWVNVPDPSNPPSIPEGQDALARFDADNMNRIEDGIAKATEDLLKKAPSGHGLGSLAYGVKADNFNSIFRKGGGFYSITSETDAPNDLIYWFSVFQNLRGLPTEDKPTGAQLAVLDYFDYNTAFPRMWLRTALEGKLSDWVEMLHTGNASQIIQNFGFLKAATGSYKGSVNNTGSASEVMLTFDFEPKLIILQGKTQSSRMLIATFPHGCDGRYMYGLNGESAAIASVSVVWEENSVKFQLNTGTSSRDLNWCENTYTYVAIG